jgi:transcriptional regulator with XRE-family HTH domain
VVIMDIAAQPPIRQAVRMPGTGPTIRARRLGQRLRDLRERAGLGADDTARRLGWSRAKLVRFETATAVPRPADTAALCDLYGASSDERALLVSLAADAGKRGWWNAYGDVFTGSYVADEALASRIRMWEPQLVPGLLQVEKYAWAVIEAGRPGDPEDTQRRVMARMARRTLLSKPDAPALTAIMDEAVLHRPVGGGSVMREQLEELLRPRDNVTVRVVPFTVGAFPGLEGGFTVLDFPDQTTFPTEVYAESIAGDLYPESADQITRINLAFERIEELALPPGQSSDLIRRAIEELPGP